MPSRATQFWAPAFGEPVRRAFTMPKRFASQAFGGNGRRVRGRFNGGGARRGRYAGRGRFRKVGFWGRYPGAGGTPQGSELKFHDIDWDQAVANLQAGVISNTSSLVLIGQGVTESTRIGRKAVIKSIGWRGALNMAAFAGTALRDPETVRLMIIQDKQCNGAAPAVSTSAGVLATANYQSFNNLANKGRFNVLFDKVFAMNARAGAGDGAADDTASFDVNFTFFKKCNIPIEYSGVANPSVITEVRTNNIFGLMINKTNSATGVSLDSKLRFRFSDG